MKPFETLNDIELKALAFDQLVQRQQIDKNLDTIQKRINELADLPKVPPAGEENKIESVPDRKE